MTLCTSLLMHAPDEDDDDDDDDSLL